MWSLREVVRASPLARALGVQQVQRRGAPSSLTASWGMRPSWAARTSSREEQRTTRAPTTSRTASPRRSVCRASSSSAVSSALGCGERFATSAVSRAAMAPSNTTTPAASDPRATACWSAWERRTTDANHAAGRGGGQPLTPLRPLRPHSHFPKVPTHYLYTSLSHTYGICCKGVRVAWNALLEGVSSLQAPCKALQHFRKVSAPRRGVCARRPIAGSTASRGAA